METIFYVFNVGLGISFLFIGVGTFLKVGRPGSHWHRLELLRSKANLPPKTIFSPDFSHFIFAYMSEDEKINEKKNEGKKDQYFRETPSAYAKERFQKCALEGGGSKGSSDEIRS